MNGNEGGTATVKSGTRRSLLFVAGLLAIALAAWGCMQFAFAAGADARFAIVTDGIGGTHRISLDEDGTYPIKTDLGTNVIVVEHGEAHMGDADCPGHDCIEQGAISNPGEIIVCLPHKLIVTVEGTDDEAVSAIEGGGDAGSANGDAEASALNDRDHTGSPMIDGIAG
ncbi:NusG domain II-containing protein [Raoultibacter phocaeensis]|uniref:NusG domain II-containing protein n=1 Tax=Raoultibacter phocaeensis TaxID=2479841 RepID=UPI0011183116|nr:NusG domain II-containing protein [Raoultibacter phocaeensis]